MPKNLTSSLAMLMIGTFIVTLTLVMELREALIWIFVIGSLPLNVLGAIGVITHSRTRRNEGSE